MKAAFHAGLSLETLPSWETMRQTAIRSLKDSDVLPSEALISDRWKQRLIYPGRIWHICDLCFPPMLPYLPKNPVQITADKETLGWLIPMNVSTWAIFAGYAGMFAVLFFPAPIALILGILALRDVRAHPELDGKGRAIFATVMGAIFTAFLVLFFIILAMGSV